MRLLLISGVQGAWYKGLWGTQPASLPELKNETRPPSYTFEDRVWELSWGSMAPRPHLPPGLWKNVVPHFCSICVC